MRDRRGRRERRGRRRGRQAAFLWPQLRELQSLKCSAVSKPAISGHVTNEIKQHDMSVFRIKEETSNQHAGVYTTSLPPSFALFLPPSSSLADCHPHHGRDDPFSVSIFAPLCSPLANWGRHLRLRPSIIGLTAGPRRGRPCYLDSVMMTSSTNKKGGPSFPHRPGMAEVWFGASIPSPACPWKTHWIHWPHV